MPAWRLKRAMVWPVSYTHFEQLSMAQPEGSARLRPSKDERQYISDVLTGVEAVSYTHLDVYKRQTQLHTVTSVVVFSEA